MKKEIPKTYPLMKERVRIIKNILVSVPVDGVVTALCCLFYEVETYSKEDFFFELDSYLNPNLYLKCLKTLF